MTRDDKLVRAAQQGDTSRVRRALRGGADADATDRGATALWWACQQGYIQVARLLVSHGANVSFSDEHGFTPLHQAVGNNHSRVASFLLGKGANVNARAQADGGSTALHIAGSYGLTKCARVLLRHGAAPGLRHKDTGESAADMASAGGYPGLADLIGGWKAQQNAPPNGGPTVRSGNREPARGRHR